jgi:hypothetical protein
MIRVFTVKNLSISPKVHHHKLKPILYSNPKKRVSAQTPIVAYARRNELTKEFITLTRMKELTRHIDQIKRLCDSNRVKSLLAFGSVTTDKFQSESDIDLVVEIDDSDPMTYSDSYFNLKFQLEQLLKRQLIY